MKVHRVTLLLFCIAVLILRYGECLKHYEFKLQLEPPVGPLRLSVGWMERSLPSCIVKCKARYGTTCDSIMYNHVTNLCTPAQYMYQSQPIPTADEGDLYYAGCPLNFGFELHSYGDTVVCVYNYTTPLNYTDAGAVCESMDSHLYIPKTLEKIELLRTLRQGDFLWLGLNDMEEEGKYIFVDDGTEIDPDYLIASFANGKASNANPDNDCVWLNKRHARRLATAPCSIRQYFFCEIYL